MTSREFENLPNEPGSWDLDFSFDYLRTVYEALSARFELATLGEAPAKLASPRTRPLAFVRHDVDVSLRRARDFARRVSGWNAKATYHVMLDSPFYDLRLSESRAILVEIAKLGNEVGLHYDVAARGMKDASPADRERDIEAACAELEDLLDEPVRSLSFHLPIEDLLRGPLLVAGRTSGYAAELFRWYLSDSRARFREGPPLESLEKPRGDVLQILFHPVWWGEANERPDVRLRALVEELATERNEPYAKVRDRMSAHILYRAADPSPGCANTPS